MATDSISFGNGAQGVEINEINNSFYPAPISSQVNGSIFILSDFGPINTPVNITTVQQFEQTFGTMTTGVGDGNMMQYPYTVAQTMIKNGIPLWVERVGVGSSTTGTPGAVSTLDLTNLTSQQQAQLVSQAQLTVYTSGMIEQAYVGTGGNLIAVKNDPLTLPNKPTFEVYFNGTLVESYDYYKSQSTLATRINSQSNYIRIPTQYITSFTQQLNTPLYYATSGEPVELLNGSNDQIVEETIVNTITNSKLYNSEAYTINFVFVGGYTEIYPKPSGDDGQSIISALTSLVEQRKDCILIGELPLNTSVASIATLQTENPDVTPALGQYMTTNGFTSVYHPWIFTTDPISGYNIYVPPSLVVAPIYANIATMQKPWIAPAGKTYGQVSALGLSQNLSRSDQDILQFNQINPIMNYVTSGIYVWGQKTQVTARSALDRVHARLTTTYIEQNIKNIVEKFLFADYTTSTVNKLNSEVISFLNGVEKSGGITYYNWQIVDSPVYKDQHKLVQNLQFVVVSTIEYITLNFTIESNELVISEQ